MWHGDRRVIDGLRVHGGGLAVAGRTLAAA